MCEHQESRFNCQNDIWYIKNNMENVTSLICHERERPKNCYLLRFHKIHQEEIYNCHEVLVMLEYFTKDE